MTVGNQFYGRVGYVKIQGPDGKMYQYGGGSPNVDALDFKFSVKKPIGAVHTDAKIDILGLNRETIEFLTYFGKRSNERAMKRKIEVWGGYEDTGPGLLFTGYVFNALPTQPPDRWLHIEADNYPMDASGIMSKRFSNCSVKTILKECADFYGAKFEWDPSIKDKKIASFIAKGTFGQILADIEPLDKNILFYKDGDWFKAVNRTNPDGVYKRRDGLVISTENGMLNIQHVGIDGIVVKNRLSQAYERGEIVTVKSEMIPAANGDYVIYEIEHKGHFRGNDWDTIIRGYMTEQMLKKIDQMGAQ